MLLTKTITEQSKYKNRIQESNTPGASITLLIHTLNTGKYNFQLALELKHEFEILKGTFEARLKVI